MSLRVRIQAFSLCTWSKRMPRQGWCGWGPSRARGEASSPTEKAWHLYLLPPSRRPLLGNGGTHIGQTRILPWNHAVWVRTWDVTSLHLIYLIPSLSDGDSKSTYILGTLVIHVKHSHIRIPLGNSREEDDDGVVFILCWQPWHFFYSC